MPIPKPTKGEKQSDYISRCNEALAKDFKNPKMRNAICYKTWDKAKGTQNEAMKGNRMPLINVKAEPGLVRNEVFNSRDHMVVPMVVLVEGVMHSANAEAPAMALAEEFGRFPQSWDGRPVVVDHPEVDGVAVSASSPAVMENEFIGYLFNTKLEDKKLKTEAWIDLGIVDQKGDRVKQAIELLKDGSLMEVSTGLFASVEETSGEYDGKEYAGIWRNIAPDHLALLPNAIGACSVEDGCGAPRVNLDGTTCDCEDCTAGNPCQCGLEANVMSTARTPSFDGTETTSWANVTKTVSSYVDGWVKHGGGSQPDSKRVQDLPAAAKRWIASKTLLGDASANNNRDLLMFPVVNPSTNKLNEGALRAVISGRGAQANIPAAAKTSAQNKARALLKSEFKVDLSTNMDDLDISVWDRILKKLGLKSNMTDDDIRAALQAAIHESVEGYAYVVAVNDDKTFVYATYDGMMRQAYTIRGDGTIQLKGSPEKVRSETSFVPVKVAEKGASTVGRTEMINALISSDKSPFEEVDRDWLDKLAEERLASFMKAATEHVTLPERKIENEGKVENNDGGAQNDLTVEEYLNMIPMGAAREAMLEGIDLVTQKRDNLTAGILANPRNKFSEGYIRMLSMSDLEKMAELALVAGNYAGRGGPRTQVTVVNANEPPPPPEVFSMTKKSA